MVPEPDTGPSVRRADEGELALVIDLASAAYAELAHERGGALLAATQPLPNAKRVATAIAAGKSVALLGLYAGVVVGAAIVHKVPTPVGALGVAELIYVDPGARSVGVGEALIDGATTWCTEVACVGLDVPALPGTRAAKSFLETTGFRARLLVMHRPLPQD
jgi:GNAT superfamily N-acetyltransferase